MRSGRSNKLKWYIHRLLSMGPSEILYRLKSQIIIWQERTAVRNSKSNYSPYTIPREMFREYKKKGLPVFYFDSTSEDFRNSLYEYFPDGIEATINSAELILQGKIAMFGHKLALDDPIQWSKDLLTNNVWPTEFWADINVRDGQTIGGVKWVRELNRHHQFTTLAKAYWCTKDERFAEALIDQFQSWIESNPPLIGVAWSSALTNAIRIINWIWALHFIHDSPRMTEPVFNLIMSAVISQTEFIRRHLSRFSSANNHLIGEAAGLVFTGLTLPWIKEANDWRETGLRILTAEIETQIYPDGVPAEQALNYLAFDLDFFILIWRLAQLNNITLPSIWQQQLGASCEFIAGIIDGNGRPPAIGDSDDGRVVALDETPSANPFCSILASATVLLERPDFVPIANQWDEKSHWLFGLEGKAIFETFTGPQQELTSRLFQHGGYALMKQNETSALFDFGPVGYLSLAAHGHADALSLLLNVQGEPILIDPGTFAYREGGPWRRFFRGTSAHNTITIDGMDQSEMKGDFLWGRKANSKLLNWHKTSEYDLVSAEHDGYTDLGTIHRRTILFYKPDWFLVQDELSGEGTRLVEQFWHFPIKSEIVSKEGLFSVKVENAHLQLLTDNGPNISSVVTQGRESPIQGWISSFYGHKQPAPVVSIGGQLTLPLRLSTLIKIGEPQPVEMLTKKKERLIEIIHSHK